MNNNTLEVVAKLKPEAITLTRQNGGSVVVRIDQIKAASPIGVPATSYRIWMDGTLHFDVTVESGTRVLGAWR